jgi:Fe-S-cluster containining protein
MHCLRCGECCKETEMLLSNEDIERLERKGYVRDFFVRFDKEGYGILRNQAGNCVFFDPEKRVCRERASRPLGCRIYPVMHDEDKGIVIDDICPARNTISEKQKAKRGKKVLKLLQSIDAEAKKSRSQ